MEPQRGKTSKKYRVVTSINHCEGSNEIKTDIHFIGNQ